MNDNTRVSAYAANGAVVFLFCFGSYEWTVRVPVK